jgi:hypothetical protein
MEASIPGQSAGRGSARATVVALAFLVAVAVAAALPCAAVAGGVGKWTGLTGPTGTNLTQVTLVQTPDGLLHVAWTGASATAGRDDLLHRVIKASGSFGTKQQVETGWSAINDPAILRDPVFGDLGIVFSGIRGAYAGDPYQRMTMTTSSNLGSTWSLLPSLIDPPSSQSWASPVAAAYPGSTLFTTWYGSSGVWVHRGTVSSVPSYDYQSGLGSFGYYSNLGLEKAGALWLVWASNATGHAGVYAQLVDQTSGAPGGPRYKLPYSTTKWSGAQRFSMMMSRVPVAGRTKGSGVFVAYPTGYPSTKKVRLWKITAAKRTTMVVAGGTAIKDQTAVAAGPDGRVWVVWSQRASGRWKIVVRRSNATVTRFGPTKAYSLPSGYRAVWHLAAAVRNGKLDVLAHAGGGSKANATLHIQVRAPK